MIRIKHKGNFRNTERFFSQAQKATPREILERYGQAGVTALASATPVDSGATAAAWGYEIAQNPDGYSIFWTNTNINEGVNIAVILQYGHGTGTGGYVEGVDYINPALRQVFEQLADEAWREVTS
ncbi:MAG: hypothetical protein IJ523_07430 [Succinivibrionaceae bacterium]|nr:hypothetical protein [Succinivibrionaceae bacterium]